MAKKQANIKGEKYISVFFLGISLASLIRTFLMLFNSFLPDFSVYYYTTQAIIKGIDPYSLKNIFSVLNYPPQTLLLFIPLASLELGIASKIWLISSILFIIGGIFTLYKISKADLKFISIFFFLSVISFPFKYTLGMGQINLLLLLILCSLLLAIKRNKKFYTGLILSLAFFIKVFPIVFLTNLIIIKKYASIVYFLLVSVSTIVLSFLIFRPEHSLTYLHEVLPIVVGDVNLSYYNQSLSGLFARLNIPYNVGFILRLSVFAISILFIFKNKNNIIGGFCLMLTTILMINSFTWQHHLILLLIPFYFLSIRSKTSLTLVLLLISYILTASNINRPELYDNKFYSAVLLSHPFFGVAILWALQVSKLNLIKNK